MNKGFFYSQWCGRPQIMYISCGISSSPTLEKYQYFGQLRLWIIHDFRGFLCPKPNQIGFVSSKGMLVALLSGLVIVQYKIHIHMIENN